MSISFVLETLLMRKLILYSSLDREGYTLHYPASEMQLFRRLETSRESGFTGKAGVEAGHALEAAWLGRLAGAAPPGWPEDPDQTPTTLTADTATKDRVRNVCWQARETAPELPLTQGDGGIADSNTLKAQHRQSLKHNKWHLSGLRRQPQDHNAELRQQDLAPVWITQEGRLGGGQQHLYSFGGACKFKT